MEGSNIDYKSFFELYPFDSAVGLSIRKAREFIDKSVDVRVDLYKRIDRMRYDSYIDYETTTNVSLSDYVAAYDIVLYQIEREILKKGQDGE